MEDLEKILSVLKDVSVDCITDNSMVIKFEDNLYQVNLLEDYNKNGSNLIFRNVYYFNGEISEKYTENSDGQIHGLFQSWYSNGQKCREENYVNGKKHGLQREWYDNGNKFSKLSFVNDKRHGLQTKWYSNGQKGLEYNYVDGKKHGFQQNWFSYGQKSKEENYVNGKKHGLQREYFSDGNLSYELNFVNGKSHGFGKAWYLNGKKKFEMSSIDEQNNSVKYWYSSGQLCSEFNMVNEELHGPYNTWYEDGNIFCELNFVNGEYSGLCKWWNNNGRLKKEIDCLNGSIISKKEFDQFGRKLFSKIPIDDIEHSIKTEKKPGRKKKHGEDPIGYYFENYCGLTNDQLKDISGLYNRLKKEGLLEKINLRRQLIDIKVKDFT